MIVPLPEPDGVTVHHVALLVAVQVVFEVTEKLVVPAIKATFWFGGVTASTGGAPVWVTVTACASKPPEGVVVIKATRLVMPGLSV